MLNETHTHKIIGCAMNVHRALGNGFHFGANSLEFKRVQTIEIPKLNVDERQLAAYYKVEETAAKVFYITLQISPK